MYCFPIVVASTLHNSLFVHHYESSSFMQFHWKQWKDSYAPTMICSNPCLLLAVVAVT